MEPSPTPVTADIFISHSQPDRWKAEEIAGLLRQQGLSPWLATTDIREGQWRVLVEEALDAAPVFLLLVSSLTTYSVEVENEFRRAVNNSKRVVVLRTEECQPPLYAAALHYLDGRRGPGVVTDLADIVRAELARRQADEASYLERMLGAPSLVAAYAPLALSYEEIHGAGQRLRLDQLVARVLSERGQPAYDSQAPSHITNLSEVIDAIRVGARSRVALIGDPGAGKTTTLTRLAFDIAKRSFSQVNEQTVSVPVLASFNAYTGTEPLLQYIRRNSQVDLRELENRLESLAIQGRLVVLLDGLNEMPQFSDVRRLDEIKRFLRKYPSVVTVITCRKLDYSPELGLGFDQIRIEPLTPPQILDFLKLQLSDYGKAVDNLFWTLCGDSQWASFLPRFIRAGGTNEEFWSEKGMPAAIQAHSDPLLSGISVKQFWLLWLAVRDNQLNLLTLCRNPYMLSMLVQVFRANRGALPGNAHELFSVFVDVLMQDEEARVGPGGSWVNATTQYSSLTAVAVAMRSENLNVLPRERVVELLGAEKMLSIAINEKILSGEMWIAFTHQLLQEFFASWALEQSQINGESISRFFPKSEWWVPTGWEEALVLLAGKASKSPAQFLDWIREINPETVVRCIREGGISPSPAYLDGLSRRWQPRMLDQAESNLGRAAIGRALGRLGLDSRFGVSSVESATKLPEFDWVRIGQREHIAGSGAAPPYEFEMTRYLVTNCHFDAFIEDGGYTPAWNHCWTEAGLKFRSEKECPLDYADPFTLMNHPRIGVRWYEAVAFGRWLTVRLRAVGQLSPAEEIRLPTENEWVAAAGGQLGTDYPWGTEFDYSLCNITDFRSTTAVGIYPGGASSDGIVDLIGNCWEWTLTRWDADPRVQDNRISGNSPRVYCGGSWAFDTAISVWRPEELRIGARHGIAAEDGKPDAIGIRLVRGPVLTEGDPTLD